MLFSSCVCVCRWCLWRPTSAWCTCFLVRSCQHTHYFVLCLIRACQPESTLYDSLTDFHNKCQNYTCVPKTWRPTPAWSCAPSPWLALHADCHRDLFKRFPLRLLLLRAGLMPIYVWIPTIWSAPRVRCQAFDAAPKVYVLLCVSNWKVFTIFSFFWGWAFRPDPPWGRKAFRSEPPQDRNPNVKLKMVSGPKTKRSYLLNEHP